MHELKLFYIMEKLKERNGGTIKTYFGKGNADFRVLAHKQIYLLMQLMIDDLDFVHYPWTHSIYGPYSYQVSYTLNYLCTYYDDIIKGNTVNNVTKEDRDRIDRAIENLWRFEDKLRELMLPLELKDVEMYEIAATIHYIASEILDLNLNISRNDLVKLTAYNFSTMKDTYTDRIGYIEVDGILNLLMEGGFLRSFE